MRLSCLILVLAAILCGPLQAAPSTASSSEVQVRLSTATSVAESQASMFDSRFNVFRWSDYCALSALFKGFIIIYR